MQMNTNGIKLALSPETMRQVRNAGVSNLYLSFDGVTPRTNQRIIGKFHMLWNLLENLELWCSFLP